MKKKVAVLIPCCNEAQTIAKVVKDYKKVLPEAKIYVYDNNSTDGSAKIAKLAGAIVRFENRQGKGNVVKAMFRDIEADCYLMADGDDACPANKARKMCEMILTQQVDMVIGDRLSSDYFNKNNRRFHNIGNRIIRFLVNLICKSQIKDAISGYRAFSRNFVKSCPITSEEFEVETEMTIYALRGGFLVREIPISYRNREDSVSKLRTLRDGFKVLMMILKLFKKYRPGLFFGVLVVVFIVIALIFGVMCGIVGL